MNRTVLNIAKTYIPYSLRVTSRKINWKRLYYQKIASHVLKGGLPKEKVFCPVSNKPYFFFIDIRNDKVSPDLGAKARHRLLWLYLEQKTELFARQNDLLHIAPEYCFFTRLNKEANIRYYPGDKFETGYGVQNGVHQLDLTQLNLPDNTFDYIICSHILEHIPNDLKAMQEMFRVLKPGGQAFIMVPIDYAIHQTYEDFSIVSPEERQKHYGQWDHVRFYSMDISERLKSVGFGVEPIRYAEQFSEKEYKKFGLNDDHIFVAFKK